MGDIDLDALAAKVAPLVVARLASALGATEKPYTTRPGDPMPPEYRNRRAWLQAAPSIPGAVRLGKRWWSVPRAAHAAWLAAQSPAQAPATPTAREPWHPSHELARLRLVSTGKG